MALIVSTWLWGSKYPAHYVERLHAGVRRHLRQDHEFRVFHPLPEDDYLTRMPGCLCRIRTFDPAWQARQGIAPGDRIVVMDLDLIVTGGLDAVFDRPEPFVILQGVNASNPCPYNGSLWMLRAGHAPGVWSEFSVEAAANVPFFSFPDDQAWLAAKLPGAAGFGPRDGVYAYRKPGWPAGDVLPPHARVVAFPGHRDPAQFTHMEWVRRHWR